MRRCCFCKQDTLLKVTVYLVSEYGHRSVFRHLDASQAIGSDLVVFLDSYEVVKASAQDTVISALVHTVHFY